MDLPAPQDMRGPMRWPQFRLRTLMLLVAGLAVVFGVMSAVGPVGSAALALLLAMVGLHVAGNALGTSLRGRSPVDVAGRRVHERPRLPEGGEISRLSERKPLSRMILAITICGAIGGFWTGTQILAEYTRASLLGAMVGAISSGILGGFLAFLGGSFLAIILGAWWQATHGPKDTFPPANRRGLT